MKRLAYSESMRRLALVFLFAGMAACGLDLAGIEGTPVDETPESGLGPGFDGGVLPDATDEGTVGDASIVDASISDASVSDAPMSDAGNDASIPDASADANDAATAPDCGCPTAVTAGWTRVGLAPTPATTCPTGYVPFDGIENPTAQASACACGTCAITTPPSCASGAIVNTIDNSSGTAMCNNTGVTAPNTTAGACLSWGGNVSLAKHIQSTPPAATGGACASTGVANRGGVVSSAARECTPSGTACEATLCGAGAGVSECIAKDGDQACPAGPFVTKHLVGGDFTLACSACGCAASATCKGTLVIATDNACTQNTVNLVVDGTCRAPSSIGGSYGFYEYVGVVNTQACSASGTSAATVGVTATPRTICCR